MQQLMLPMQLPPANIKPTFATLLYTSAPSPERTIRFTSQEKLVHFLRLAWTAMYQNEEPIQVRNLKLFSRNIEANHGITCDSCGSNWIEKTQEGEYYCAPCWYEDEIFAISHPENHDPSVPITGPEHCPDGNHMVTRIFMTACICQKPA